MSDHLVNPESELAVAYGKLYALLPKFVEVETFYDLKAPLKA